MVRLVKVPQKEELKKSGFLGFAVLAAIVSLLGLLPVAIYPNLMQAQFASFAIAGYCDSFIVYYGVQEVRQRRHSRKSKSRSRK